MLHHELQLEFNADSTECCTSFGWRHLVAAGTYQLDETTQKRNGRIYLYQVQAPIGHAGLCVLEGDKHDAANIAAQQNYKLQQVYSLDVPGVFDMKWAPVSAEVPSSLPQPASKDPSSSVLGAALADGTLRVLQLQLDDSKPQLAQVASCQACEEGMCLSLAWQPATTPGTQKSHTLVTSSSSGTLSLLQVGEGGISRVQEWDAHTLEAWCAAFSHQEPHIVFSGADDCMFKAWDVRVALRHAAVQGSCPTHLSYSSQTQTAAGEGAGEADNSTSLETEVFDEDCAPPCIFTNKKTHEAGVCTVSPHPLQPHILATGSYDERVRLWDTRNSSRPLLISEARTGGGNWRLRWHPTDPNLLLAAAMYNGFALLRAHESYSKLDVVEEYKGHGSIAYGADWVQMGADAEVVGEQVHPTLIATASFYDRLLHLWSPEMAAAQPLAVSA